LIHTTLPNYSDPSRREGSRRSSVQEHTKPDRERLLRCEGYVVGLHWVIVAVIQLFAAIPVPDVNGMAHEQRLHRTPKGGGATVIRIVLRMVVDLGEDGCGPLGARPQEPRERMSVNGDADRLLQTASADEQCRVMDLSR
jgi:hypothetical protein